MNQMSLEAMEKLTRSTEKHVSMTPTFPCPKESFNAFGWKAVLYYPIVFVSAYVVLMYLAWHPHPGG